MKLRTVAEIVAKLKIVSKEDMLGWGVPDYVIYLDYEHAKEYLKDDVSKSEWKKKIYSLEEVLKVMREYLPFAYEKANGRRGISANRSMDHFKNWYWLLGEDELSENVWNNYGAYGLPKLKEIDEWLSGMEVSDD